MLGKKEARIREERRQQRLKENKPEVLTGEAAIMEDAYVLDLTLKDLARSQGNLGQIMLAGFWRMFQGKHYLIFEEESLLAYAINQMPEHIDVYYVRSLAKAAETILKYVYDAEISGKPILDPDTQTPITVNLLIATPGLVSKLKENADHFATLTDDKQRLEMLVAIATKGRVEVKATKARQKGVNGKIEQFVGIEKFNTKSKKTTLVLENLDDKQLAYVKKALKRYLDLHLDAKAEAKS